MNTRLPFMKRWPMQFWADEDVAWLAAEDEIAHLIYSALLDHMWANGGSLRDDDRAIAGMLKVSLGTWVRVRPVVTNVLVSFTDNDGVLRLTQKRLAKDFDLALAALEERDENLRAGRDKANAAKAKRSKAKKPSAQDRATGADDRAKPQAPAKPPPPQVPATGAANAKQSRADTEEDTDVSSTVPSSETVVVVERGSGGEKMASKAKVEPDQDDGNISGLMAAIRLQKG